MHADELTRAMLAGEHTDTSTLPDLHVLRTRARRHRRNSRAVMAGMAAVTAGVVATGVTVAAHNGLLDRADEPAPVAPSGDKVLSSYEKRVLREVPGSFAVEGMVVVQAPIDPDNILNQGLQVDGFSGRLAPLGWHSMWSLSDGPIRSTVTFPTFMQKPPPDNTQVIQDSGPMHIGCRHGSARRCLLFFVVGDARTGWFTSERAMGDDKFLEAGRPMELIPGGTLEDGRLEPTVVGGMQGTATTRVVLDLKDGSTAPATVDRGRISRGDTVFWARLDSRPVRATAYDAAGRVVEDHPLTPCDDPVDCETR